MVMAIAEDMKKLTENIIKKYAGQVELFAIETFWEKCLNIFKRPLKTIQKKKNGTEKETPSVVEISPFGSGLEKV